MLAICCGVHRWSLSEENQSKITTSLWPLQHIPRVESCESIQALWGQTLQSIGKGDKSDWISIVVTANLFTKLLEKAKITKPRVLITHTCAVSLRSREMIALCAYLGGCGEVCGIVAPQYLVPMGLSTDIYLVELPLDYYTVRVEGYKVTWAWLMQVKTPPRKIERCFNRSMLYRKSPPEAKGVDSRGMEYTMTSDDLVIILGHLIKNMGSSKCHFEEWPIIHYTLSMNNEDNEDEGKHLPWNLKIGHYYLLKYTLDRPFLNCIGSLPHEWEANTYCNIDMDVSDLALLTACGILRGTQSENYICIFDKPNLRLQRYYSAWLDNYTAAYFKKFIDLATIVLNKQN